MTGLVQYYESLGYPQGRWHIGAEHPALEEHAIGLLRGMPSARVLEIGYQAGGFAVPVILALHALPHFVYVGVDSLAYGSAVDGGVISRYLARCGAGDSYRFVAADAARFLSRVQPAFDLVLIDHDKRLYPRDLRTVLRRGLVAADGCVLMHDVLGKARAVFGDCCAIALGYGFAAEIIGDVPQGLAVFRRKVSLPLAPSERAALLAARARIMGRQGVSRLREWRRQLAKWR